MKEWGHSSDGVMLVEVGVVGLGALVRTGTGRVVSRTWCDTNRQWLVLQ